MAAAAYTDLKAHWGRAGSVLSGLALFLGALLANTPALDGGLVWDDAAWTTDILPLLRDTEGLLQMWLSPTALQQYYPVTGTTFWVDYQLWGDWTLPYHVQNILWHGAAGVLLWRFLLRLRVPGAWLAAAVFVMHPMMVESVSWITERKNVVSLAFLLCALHAWARGCGWWQELPHVPGWRAGALAAAFFVIAMLSKATATCFPAIVLLLAWWKRGKLGWRSDIRPTVPLFTLAITAGLAFAWLEKHGLGAQGADWEWTVWERLLLAGRSWWFYPLQCLWPDDLCFCYPWWKLDPANILHWLWPGTAIAVPVALFVFRRRLGRGAVTACFLYSGLIFPALGFLPMFGLRYAPVADHWFYLACTAIVIPVIATSAAYAQKWHIMARGAAGAALLCVLAVLSWRESRQYQNIETLYRRTLAKNPASWLVHTNLGQMMEARGNLDAAKRHYEQALLARPWHAEAHLNLGNILRNEGKAREAISHYEVAAKTPGLTAQAHYNRGVALDGLDDDDAARAAYEKAIELEPNLAVAHNNIGLLAAKKGDWQTAEQHYLRALQEDPQFASASYNLGNARFARRDYAGAQEAYQKTISLNPSHAAAHNGLGNLHIMQGNREQAAEGYARAVESDPRLVSAQVNLANILLMKRDAAGAARHFEKALEASPLEPAALRPLAWLLATCPDDSVRNGSRAVTLAQTLTANSETAAANYNVLAAAYAEAQRFEDAASTSRKAEQLAANAGQPTTAIEAQTRLYEGRQPFRDPALGTGR